MLFLVLLLVSAAAAQTQPGSTQPIPARCCIARQFEAKMGQTGGALYNYNGHEAPVLEDLDNVMHYDYYNRTLIIEMNSHNPDQKTTTYFRLIQDYKTRTQYIFGDGKCTTSRLDRRAFREPCIPDHAVFLGHSTVGYGINSLAINSWQYPEPGTGNDFKLALTESCVPVVEAIIGVINGAPSEVAFLITDFEPGMTKPSVFQLPDLCKNSNDVVENEDHPLHIRRAIMAMEGLVN